MDFSKLTAYLDGLKDAFGVPQTEIAVTVGHETVYRHLTGFSDFEGRVPASESDRYYFYSATKLITMTAVMREIEQGRMRLYEPVCAYLPEFETMTVIDREFSMEQWPPKMPQKDEPQHYAARQIRIIDLMSMMSGMTYDTSSEAVKRAAAEAGGRASTRELVAAMAEMPLAYEPGTRWLYSLGHDVLAAAVEVTSGERFGDYLRKFVFGPAGAEDLGFSLPEGVKLTAQYTYDMGRKKIVPTSDKNVFILSKNYESGGAGLIGTVSAYAGVVEALANGGETRSGERILSEKSVRMFMSSVTTGKAQEDFLQGKKKPYAYGLGVRVRNEAAPGSSPVGEFGWDGAAGAYALVDPVNRVGIAYAQHVLNFMPVYDEIHPAVRDLVYEALGL
ncbi:MAG: beta-lactamase family protein [Oscillospiraceae bacterium]|nr:beta-lactamase family protein [Oscillospiraceae bacterium]